MDFCMHGKLSKLIQSSMPQGLRILSFQLRSFFLRIAKVCGFLVMLADTALCTAVSLSEGQRKESQLSFLMDSWLCWLFVLGNSCMDSRCSKWIKMETFGWEIMQSTKSEKAEAPWHSGNVPQPPGVQNIDMGSCHANSWLNCTLSSLVFHSIIVLYGFVWK